MFVTSCLPDKSRKIGEVGNMASSARLGQTDGVGAGCSAARPRCLGKSLHSGSLLASAALAFLLAPGCHLPEWAHNGFKVGPNYSKPPAPVAPEWIDYKDPRVKSEEADLSEWWHVFKDPALGSLEDLAYRQNLTLREAGTRILQARAIRAIACGNLFPQVQQANGSYTRFKLSEQIANPFKEPHFDNWATTLNGSWELDIWGLFRRSLESADAALDASVEDYDNVLVILLADVASSYLEFRTFQERLTYTRQNVEIQTRGYQLAEDRFKAGATSERDVQQAKQILEQTKALIPDLEKGMRQAGNSLCVLLGIPPEDLTRVLGAEGVIPPTPIEVVVGIPADLLRRRPDVRRAERLAAAQCAQIGVAVAEFYPHIAINGTIGVAAAQFSHLFDVPSAGVGSIGPSFTWNILNYGRILNNVRLQDARFQELVYTYQDTVLTAGREAEDAIIGFLKAQQRTESLGESVKAAQRTEEITYEQYKQGAVDFTPLLLVEQTLAQQQDQLAQSRGDIALNLIAVYRAIGGGWEMRLARDGNGCAPAPAAAGPPPPGAPPAGERLPPPRLAPPVPAS
jgi:NodT family efflux transporter outer membrane factor (OMF) lipoprotein